MGNTIVIVKITNKKHPHYGEEGSVVEENQLLSLSFLGRMDRIRGNDGQEFFADKKDYKVIRIV